MKEGSLVNGNMAKKKENNILIIVYIFYFLKENCWWEREYRKKVFLGMRCLWRDFGI